MSKRSKRSMQEETFFNGIRKDEMHQPGKRLFASGIFKVAKDNSKETCVHSIPLPFMDELNDTYGNTPIASKSLSIDCGAANLFPDSSTIPLPTSPNKPSTSSAFTFQGSARILENISVLTDSESTSTENSDDELASVSSADSPKAKKRTITSSDYYRARLIQLEREQQDRRERWKKKLEIMEKFLNK